MRSGLAPSGAEGRIGVEELPATGGPRSALTSSVFLSMSALSPRVRTVSVRPASDSDGPAVAAVMTAVYAFYPGCLYEEAEYPEHRALASHYEARAGAAWVAELDGRLVGSLAIERTRDPQVFELHKVYLLPEARGTGAARQMLEAALDLARAAGGRRVRLWSDTRFREGHAFYDRNGFARIGAVRFLDDVSRSWEFAYVRELA